MRACLMIRSNPHYRREAFEKGLQNAGYRVHVESLIDPKPGDLLVIWNRYGERDGQARNWERAGGIVLVAENGYLGHDANGVQMYALALNGHAGSGQFPVGDGSRFAALGVELKPWRAQGGYVVVCGQRGIGSPTMASPPDWHRDVARRLAKAGWSTRIREHDGKPANDPATVAHMRGLLADAHACVVWSSANGVRALVEGVPVCREAPHSIVAGAVQHGICGLREPLMDDARRLAALERMAWAQWSVAELETGEPFGSLAQHAVELRAKAA